MSASLAIPASQIVSVTPSVISAGGSALDLNGLLLTNSTRAPQGQVLSFPTAPAVASYFGGASLEAQLAANYFLGFDNSNRKPGALLFAQYNQSAVGGWLRGAPLGLTLTQLQGQSGTFSVTIDGVPRTSSSVNFSSASSFTAAAELMTVALGLTGPAQASFTGSVSATVLTVSSVSSGTLAVGQELRGAGVTAGTLITGFGTGTGGTGTYTLNNTMSVASSSLTTNTPTVTYDSITGAFQINSASLGSTSTVGYVSGPLSTTLGLTQAAGAVSSPGAAAATPAAFMTNISLITKNWAAFTTTFDPDNGSGNSVKQAFASWTNLSNDEFAYVAWDTDASPTVSGAATNSLGNLLEAANSSGTIALWVPNAAAGQTKAAFILGYIASIDFTETNGRATAAFRGQTGLAPDVTSGTVASNLLANGYNFYGTYATANDAFTWLYDGHISGPFLWIDSYVNQIWLNNQFQLALMVLLQNAKSIPYNASGYALIRAALMDPIIAGLNFGAFRAGVTLSQAQIAEVNNAAGTKIDDVLSTQGWYLQVKDAAPQVRAARGSPPCTFWYMDGQSVQSINLASVEVQ